MPATGTYKLDDLFFPTDPIAKRWARQPVGEISGVGESIYTDFWQLELEFPTLESSAQASFFYDRWMTGGLHTALLPHPRSGQLVGFTGVNIEDWAFEFDDVEQEYWAQGPRLVLNHISMSATGSV